MNIEKRGGKKKKTSRPNNVTIKNWENGFRCEISTNFAFAVTNPLAETSLLTFSVADGDLEIQFVGLLISTCARFIPELFVSPLSSSSTLTNLETLWPFGRLENKEDFSTITQSSEPLLLEFNILLNEPVFVFMMLFPYKDANFSCVITFDWLLNNLPCLSNLPPWDNLRSQLVNLTSGQLIFF